MLFKKKSTSSIQCTQVFAHIISTARLASVKYNITVTETDP